MKKIPKNRLNLQNLQKSTSMHQLGRTTETIWSISNIRNNKASRNERPSAARSFRSERRNNLVYSICRFSNDRKTSRRVAFHANITQNRARIRGNRLDWFARGENAPRSVDGYRGEKNWWTAVFTGIFNLSYIFRADCNSRCNVENWKRTILPVGELEFLHCSMVRWHLSNGIFCSRFWIEQISTIGIVLKILFLLIQLYEIMKKEKLKLYTLIINGWIDLDVDLVSSFNYSIY